MIRKILYSHCRNQRLPVPSVLGSASPPHRHVGRDRGNILKTDTERRATEDIKDRWGRARLQGGAVVTSIQGGPPPPHRPSSYNAGLILKGLVLPNSKHPGGALGGWGALLPAV